MREPKSSNTPKDEQGFATVEFVLLMAMSIFLLTGVLNILFIEFQRDSVLTSMRDAARAGTRVVNLDPATVTSAQVTSAQDECVRVGREALTDLISGEDITVQCAVSYRRNVATMRATVANVDEGSAIVPWVIPYQELRMTDLSESFVQRKAASND